MPTLRVPSIGHEEDKRISRTEIAATQLSDAIELFLAGKYLSTITLAGAAEEILGKLASASGEKSTIDRSLDQLDAVRKNERLTSVTRAPRKEVVAHWNRARNALKHFCIGDELVVTLNICDEAYWMIRRALANAALLDVFVEKSNDFENWVIENINM